MAPSGAVGDEYDLTNDPANSVFFTWDVRSSITPRDARHYAMSLPISQAIPGIRQSGVAAPSDRYSDQIWLSACSLEFEVHSHYNYLVRVLAVKKSGDRSAVYNINKVGDHDTVGLIRGGYSDAIVSDLRVANGPFHVLKYSGTGGDTYSPSTGSFLTAPLVDKSQVLYDSKFEDNSFGTSVRKKVHSHFVPINENFQMGPNQGVLASKLEIEWLIFVDVRRSELTVQPDVSTNTLIIDRGFLIKLYYKEHI